MRRNWEGILCVGIGHSMGVSAVIAETRSTEQVVERADLREILGRLVPGEEDQTFHECAARVRFVSFRFVRVLYLASACVGV